MNFCTIALCISIIIWGNRQRKLNVELSRLDRLTTIGEMAAGIAHEVRNPMTTVRGYLQWFQTKKNFSGYYEQLETMIEEVDRANSIITEFLALAKDKPVSMKPRNLNDILNAIGPLIQAEALRSAHEVEVLTADLPMVMLDESEVRQLILNLVKNGLEAMPSGGKLIIQSFVDNGAAGLAVKDQGTGIPKKMLHKIGTPFITTKAEGTGLGLAICYQIAHRHNANIEIVTSSKGTCVYVTFGKEESVRKS